IKVDHFVKVDLEAFRKIVDEIGGVDVDVPRNMFYEDPLQNLYINLKKGPQKLNGAQAEGLVRYRPGSDVDRIQTQQLFLKAFAKQVLSERNILRISNIVKTLYEHVETDVGLDDVLQYTKYVKDINMENLHMETLPGEGKYIGKISYFIPDEPKVKESVARLFMELEEEKATVPTENTISSKECNIEVLNGGSVGGLATKTQKKLEDEGYHVASIGNYERERQNQTRIIVRTQGMGEDLKSFFNDTEVLVQPSNLPDNIDIQIVLGLKEK
ncbi:MAG: LCP family protein, partial [Epulopiscium sp.]|nr:LCP family protein [Candidatus Epulonipiscium sp.]